MDYLVVKSLHIIFMVTWFAGLFYIVRLFIYHVEAESMGKMEQIILQKQYKVMQKRLWYIITWPGAIITTVLGFWLVYMLNYWTQPFMLLKFGFIGLLWLYHYSCQVIYNQLQKDIVKYSATQLRMWNEVATLLLFAIVFVIIVGKVDLSKWYYGVVGIALLGIVFMIIVKLYKKARDKKAALKNN